MVRNPISGVEAVAAMPGLEEVAPSGGLRGPPQIRFIQVSACLACGLWRRASSPWRRHGAP